MLRNENGISWGPEKQLCQVTFNTDNYANGKKKQIETKQIERKHKTGKTSTGYIPRKTKVAGMFPGNIFYLEEEHKICCMLDISKLFSPRLGNTLK